MPDTKLWELRQFHQAADAGLPLHRVVRCLVTPVLYLTTVLWTECDFSGLSETPGRCD